MFEDCLDDEEDVLEVLAVQLGQFVEIIGGRDQVHILLPAFEILCASEQSKVREKVKKKIFKIFDKFILNLSNIL